jgi:hypothetical protein
MFAAIYRWRVIPGLEAQFEEGWRRGTIAISRELGGWGSRLHRAPDGAYIAYAQWPDEATWTRAVDAGMPHSDAEARKMYRDAIVPGSFETLFAMPVMVDALEHRIS